MRSSEVTRVEVALRPMPSQVEMVEVAFQSRVAVPFSTSLAASSVEQSATRSRIGRMIQAPRSPFVHVLTTSRMRSMILSPSSHGWSETGQISVLLAASTVASSTIRDRDTVPSQLQ